MKFAALAGALLLIQPFVVLAQQPQISYTNFITGLTAPIDIVNAGDGTNRLFIAQQNGMILMHDGGVLTPLLDIGPGGENLIRTVGSEEGLLSLVFHPGYGTVNNYFFVYYTNLAGDLAIRRYETMPGPGSPANPPIVANTATDVLIMTIPHTSNSNHNGAKLNFGTDGYLYFATGDGGGGNDADNNAQNGNVLLGKMIRIDIDGSTLQSFGNYDIPADNPYIGDPNVLDEVWALGLRNPFRWSFDRLTGDMWIGDVGQGAREEINFRPAGSTGHVNYGWRCYEGHISTPSVTDCNPVDNVYPVLDYNNPASGSSAVTGGYVYRGTDFPNLYGYYIAADVYSDSIYLLWPDGSGGFDSLSQLMLPDPDPWFIVGFGEDEDGSLYAVSQGTGSILNVVATGGTPLPVVLSSFTVNNYRGYNELKWNTAAEYQTSGFYIEFSINGRDFDRAGEIPASGNPNGEKYSFRHYNNIQGVVYYRLVIQDDDGSIKYSTILRVAGKNDVTRVYPTVVKDRVINLSLSGSASQLRILNGQGSIVFEKPLHHATGSLAISLPLLARGMYYVQIMVGNEQKTTKIIID